MTLSGLTVSDASDYSPGFVWVRWQADIASGVMIKVDGQGRQTTNSRAGNNSSLLNLGGGTHTICVEEGNY